MCRFMRCGLILDAVGEWKQGTPSSPLRCRSSDALLFLPAPSPSRHLVPICDYRRKRSINKSCHLTLCCLLRLRCSFPGNLDGLGRFTQERRGDCFCLSSSFMQQMMHSSMKTWHWEEEKGSSVQQDTDHDSRRLKMRGQGGRVMC